MTITQSKGSSSSTSLLDVFPAITFLTSAYVCIQSALSLRMFSDELEDFPLPNFLLISTAMSVLLLFLSSFILCLGRECGCRRSRLLSAALVFAAGVLYFIPFAVKIASFLHTCDTDTGTGSGYCFYLFHYLSLSQSVPLRFLLVALLIIYGLRSVRTSCLLFLILCDSAVTSFCSIAFVWNWWQQMQQVEQAQQEQNGVDYNFENVENFDNIRRIATILLTGWALMPVAPLGTWLASLRGFGKIWDPEDNYNISVGQATSRSSCNRGATTLAACACVLSVGAGACVLLGQVLGCVDGVFGVSDVFGSDASLGMFLFGFGAFVASVANAGVVCVLARNESEGVTEVETNDDVMGEFVDVIDVSGVSVHNLFEAVTPRTSSPAGAYLRLSASV